MPNPSTRLCADTRGRSFLSASPAWAVDFWSEPRCWPLGICWPCTARDLWLMDVKANLAKICAGGLSVTLLPSAPFSSSTMVPLPPWECGQRLSWRMWGSFPLIRRSLLEQRMCSHRWQWRGGAAGSKNKSTAKHSCSPLYQPSLLDPCKELSNPILDLFPSMSAGSSAAPCWVTNLREQRDCREQRKVLGRGGVRADQSPPRHQGPL